MTGGRGGGFCSAAALVLLAAGAVMACGRPAPPDAGGARRSAPAAAPPVVGLDLEQLKTEPPVPVIRRDLFRFGAPSALAGGMAQEEAAEPLLGEHETPETVAPGAAFRLIGIVGGSGPGVPPTAVLSDGRGVYYGGAGDIIEGRFRIVQVLANAVELEAFDNGSRQLIRLPEDAGP